VATPNTLLQSTLHLTLLDIGTALRRLKGLENFQLP